MKNRFDQIKPSRLTSRQTFLGHGLAAVATAVAAPCLVPASALGFNGATPPSDRICMGFVGLGGQGGGHLFGGGLDLLARRLPGPRRRAGAGRLRRAAQAGRAGQGPRRTALCREIRPWRLQGLRCLLGHPRHAPPRRYRRRADRRRLPCRRHQRDPHGQGGQGRLLREADQRDDPRRPGDRRGRAGPRPHLPGRHPATQRIRRPLPPGRRAGPRRADRPAQAGLCLPDGRRPDPAPLHRARRRRPART